MSFFRSVFLFNEAAAVMLRKILPDGWSHVGKFISSMRPQQ
jgi:hypothetical protein